MKTCCCFCGVEVNRRSNLQTACLTCVLTHVPKLMADALPDPNSVAATNLMDLVQERFFELVLERRLKQKTPTSVTSACRGNFVSTLEIVT
jgi:hypothetical protein